MKSFDDNSVDRFMPVRHSFAFAPILGSIPLVRYCQAIISFADHALHHGSGVIALGFAQEYRTSHGFRIRSQ